MIYLGNRQPGVRLAVLEPSLVSQWERPCATCIRWVEGRAAAGILQGTAPQPAVPSPSASCAEVEGIALPVGNPASRCLSPRPRCAQEASGSARGAGERGSLPPSESQLAQWHCRTATAPRGPAAEWALPRGCPWVSEA